MAEIRFSVLGESDLDWAFDVFEQTTRDDLLRVLDLTPEQQRERRRTGLAHGTFRAVHDETGTRIGLVAVADDAAAATVHHLEVLPAYQGLGWGTAILAEVAARAHADGRAVVLRVQRVNPRARALYERLGFVATEERQHSVEMTLRPPPR